MARTKQTARKCASGVAKPLQLAGSKRPRLSSSENTTPLSSPLSSPPLSPVLQAITHPEQRNRFCYLCHDGGNTLACSNPACPRVVCNVCIEIPQELEGIYGSPEISFRCPACHEKDERVAQSKPMPYFAFTRMDNGKLLPACDTPAFVRGTCERASKSQVCGGPILVLHFIYTGMNARGSLPRVLNTALEEYHTESTLRYYEIFFDFGTWDKLCQWESKAEQLVAEVGLDIFQHKVVFVSVHSEVSCGDLFAGKDENNEDVALKPNEVCI
ncbi:hypothetical protein EDD15DRAFT_2366135 [Pisolithus albus]|nr:hypothetical protein EDD15DRAFT_2366135 [Pisolithus albus]